MNWGAAMLWLFLIVVVVVDDDEAIGEGSEDAKGARARGAAGAADGGADAGSAILLPGCGWSGGGAWTPEKMKMCPPSFTI